MTVPTPRTVDLDADLRSWAIGFYEEAHATPELAHAETATTALVERELDELGIPHRRVSDTGTVGLLEHGDGPVIAFRADLDGLPVREESGLPYASTATVERDGVVTPLMHACGHDTHFTSLLAAARYLVEHPDEWAGTLVLVFQPAEETGSGADAMLAGGLWDAFPRPAVVLGQHVMPFAAGRVDIRPGRVMSLADSLTVRVEGRQAHGSMPERAIDPIVTVAAMIMRLQTIVSREADPGSGVVVTVGQVQGGTAPNIIPDHATFTVNIRTPDDEVRDRVLAAVERIVDAEAAASRATATISRLNRFPRCVNDTRQAAVVTDALRAALGETNVVESPAPSNGSEDVGALADAIGVPLVFWFFGGFEDGDLSTLPVNHTPRFAPAAGPALETGITAAILAYLGTDAPARG